MVFFMLYGLLKPQDPQDESSAIFLFPPSQHSNLLVRTEPFVNFFFNRSRIHHGLLITQNLDN